jgi:hypothetical protein
MALKVLCAGFSKDEKAGLESEVRSLLGSRPVDEKWTVSVVKTGAKVAVTVDGPDDRLRAHNFVAEPRELRSTLYEALARAGFAGGGAAVPAAAVPRQAPPVMSRAPVTPSAPYSPSIGGSTGEDEEWEAPIPGERRDTHKCPNCQKPFMVSYVAVPNEKSTLVSVACPHCWKVDRVLVGENAAIAKEYHADKAR